MKINSDGVISIRESQSQDLPLKIFLTGDTNLRALGEERVLRGESKMILSKMQPYFKRADVSVTQFETVLTTDDTPIIKSGPNLRSDPRVIDFFKEWNGDVCLMANNHTGDYGPKALMDTLDILHQNNFKTVGAGKNLDDAYRPCIFSVKDMKIGILNFAENEFGSALPDQPGSAPQNPMLNVRQIMALRPQVDILLVVTHGGNEQNPIPSPRVVDMLRTFVDVGADMVVNIHTHCPQGIEIWNGRPIVYSLGNFYFPWRTDDISTYKDENFWYSGYCVEFSVDRKGCFELQVVPTHFNADASSVYPLEGSRREAFYGYLQELSDVIPDDAKIRAFHECWAAMSSYPNRIVTPYWTPEMFTSTDPADKAKLMGLRNLMTCEAHNEVVKTYMRLMEQGRLEEVKALEGEFKRLGKASYMTR